MAERSCALDMCGLKTVIDLSIPELRMSVECRVAEIQNK